MRRWAEAIHARLTQALGASPLRIVRVGAGIPYFVRTVLAYRGSAAGSQFPIEWSRLYPCLANRAESAGAVDIHYFHQDLWAARRVFAARPPSHLDVGSRLDGFVSHLLTFMPVTMVDIRSDPPRAEGLTFVRDDACSLASIPDDSVESVSSLHAVEHFGLGRYGDPIDPEGWRKGLQSLARVLAPGGRLYLSVPVGRQRLEFNAHRVFSPSTVLEVLGGLTLATAAAVSDEGALIEDADLQDIGRSTFAAGLFEFQKPVRSP